MEAASPPRSFGSSGSKQAARTPPPALAAYDCYASWLLFASATPLPSGVIPTTPPPPLRQVGDLDFLTLDYLAEVSMSILAKQRQRDPSAGYARDFIDVIRSLAPFWRDRSRLRVVANAGGLNPRACADACAVALQEAGCAHLKIAVITGDDVLPALRGVHQRDARTRDFCHLETGEPIETIIDRLVTANAYIGACAGGRSAEARG